MSSSRSWRVNPAMSTASMAQIWPSGGRTGGARAPDARKADRGGELGSSLPGQDGGGHGGRSPMSSAIPGPASWEPVKPPSEAGRPSRYSGSRGRSSRRSISTGRTPAAAKPGAAVLTLISGSIRRDSCSSWISLPGLADLPDPDPGGAAMPEHRSCHGSSAPYIQEATRKETLKQCIYCSFLLLYPRLDSAYGSRHVRPALRYPGGGSDGTRGGSFPWQEGTCFPRARRDRLPEPAGRFAAADAGRRVGGSRPGPRRPGERSRPSRPAISSRRSASRPAWQPESQARS